MNEAALQQCIYTALTGNAALMALITGVYADVQQPNLPENDSDFPYVTIGNDVLTAWDTNTDFGASASCQIDVWSRQNNFMEAKAVGSAINNALHYQPLTITGSHHVQTRVESATYTPDPDGHTKRGMLLVRVLFDEA